MKMFLSSLVVTLSLFATNAHALSELGTSKKSCANAKQDARIIADGQCLALDTKVNNANYGNCRKSRSEYRITLRYTCRVSDLVADFDTYH